MFAISRKQMVFTFPYKPAVTFSYVQTPFEVRTPENVYHTEANIRMLHRFKLRRTYNQSRHQIVTHEQRCKSTSRKISTIRKPTEKCNGNSSTGTCTINLSLQCSQDLNNRYHETNSRLRSYVTLHRLLYSTASQWNST